MPEYKTLLSFLRSQKHFKINIKQNYCVLTLASPNKYHITIYEDQWDNYEKETGLAYHLFHVSSNLADNKCSTYFWLDKEKYLVRTIPTKYFNYEQDKFGFDSSTRKPCAENEIKQIIKTFQNIISGYHKFST